MEEPAYSVLLTGAGNAVRKLDVVRAPRSVRGPSTWRSRRLPESVPLVVLEDVSLRVAEEAARRLEAAGAGARGAPHMERVRLRPRLRPWWRAAVHTARLVGAGLPAARRSLRR
ncbi:hypothetical protein PV342_38165 [Streptomyces sp. PA03-3a]|nr:hypothetical protein [Streptomyces sp. PA03-3a]